MAAPNGPPANLFGSTVAPSRSAPVTAAYVMDKWFSGKSYSQANGVAPAANGALPLPDFAPPTNLYAQPQPGGVFGGQAVKDLTSVIEDLLDKRLESQHFAMERLLREHNTNSERAIVDEMKAHRMWVSDHFHRIGVTLEKVHDHLPHFHAHGKGLMASPREGDACPAAPALKDSLAITQNTDAPRNASLEPQGSQDVMADEGSELSADGSEMEKSGTTASKRTTPFVFKPRKSQLDAMEDPHAHFENIPNTVGLNMERDKMQRHLARMHKTDENTKATKVIYDQFGIKKDHIKRYKSKPKLDLGARYITKVVDNWHFAFLCMSVIMINAAWIGLQTNVSMENALATPRRKDPEWHVDVNRCFLVFFIVELVLRIAALRAAFFFQKDWCWNLFDSFVVATSIIEELAETLNLNFLRALRVLRMARVVRIIRVLRFFVGLRQFMLSVISCASLLVWASGCMVFLIYLFSIMFLQGALTRADEDPTINFQLMNAHFSNVMHTMYSLLLAISSGLEWNVLAEELGAIWFLFRPLLASYVIFVMFGILNVVTGVFVEKTANLKVHDRDLAIHTEMAATRSFVVELKDLFEEKGISEVDHITWPKFKEILSDQYVQMYMQTHGLDVTEAREVFLLLDYQDNGYVSLDDFVYGCQRIKGMAKSMDIVLLHEQVSTVKDKLAEAKDHDAALHRSLKDSLEKVFNECRIIRAELITATSC